MAPPSTGKVGYNHSSETTPSIRHWTANIDLYSSLTSLPMRVKSTSFIVIRFKKIPFIVEFPLFASESTKKIPLNPYSLMVICCPHDFLSPRNPSKIILPLGPLQHLLHHALAQRELHGTLVPEI